MNARLVYVMWQSKLVVLLSYILYKSSSHFIYQNIPIRLLLQLNYWKHCKSRSRIFFQKHAIIDSALCKEHIMTLSKPWPTTRNTKTVYKISRNLSIQTTTSCSCDVLFAALRRAPVVIERRSDANATACNQNEFIWRVRILHVSNICT